MANMRVKVYKTATKASIMDIIDALDYHKKNAKEEEVYRGNLEFVINEYGTSKNQESAYLTKAGAKTVFYSILNHHFPKIFAKGFNEYGGSSKNGIVRSRILTIEYEQDKHRYKFQIDEGPGRLEGNGSIKMVKKEKSVRTYVAYEDAIKLAHEVYSYVQQAEIAAIMRGKPYYTLVPDFRNNNSKQEHQQNNEYYPENIENDAPQLEEEYIIKIGKWAGTPISQIDTNTLEAVVTKVSPDSPELAELLNEIKKELGRRY